MTKLGSTIAAAALSAVLGVALASAGSASASTTINFSKYANTFLKTADGVTFSLASGYAVNGLGTTPYVNAFGDADQIANSANGGEYPTSNTLTFTFAHPVSNVSFSFDNYGSSDTGRGATYYYAYNASSGLVSSGFLGNCNECGTVSVSGSGIKSLIFDNGTGDPSGENSWLFGVDSVSFAGGVPEPATWALMLVGFGGLGAALRVRRRTSAAALA